MAKAPPKPTKSTKSAATPTPPAPPSPKLAPIPAAPPPVLVEPSTPVVAGPEMKKKELMERVAARTGMKKPDIKPVVEAILGVMGQALTDGEVLNLQPLGKMKVQRQKNLPNGQALTLKLRRSSQALDQTEGLADTDTDG